VGPGVWPQVSLGGTISMITRHLLWAGGFFFESMGGSRCYCMDCLRVITLVGVYLGCIII